MHESQRVLQMLTTHVVVNEHCVNGPNHAWKPYLFMDRHYSYEFIPRGHLHQRLFIMPSKKMNEA